MPAMVVDESGRQHRPRTRLGEDGSAKCSSVATITTIQLLDQAEELSEGRKTDRKAAQQEWHCLKVREKSGEVVHEKWVGGSAVKAAQAEAGTLADSGPWCTLEVSWVG